MKRTSDWIYSQEIPIDVVVHAGGASFSLHKFPLVSKCGLLKKLVSESADGDLSVIELPDVPGGAEAFELAAKFCYGINFEMSAENVAGVRCAAEYLQMTEEHAACNLIGRADAYLGDSALTTLAGGVAVLRRCEKLFPVAEKVKLVSRCVDAVAFIACKESQSGATLDYWWAEDLTLLRIDFFQRVLIAMAARGFMQDALGPVLMLYAQKSLRGLEMFGQKRKKMEAREEHEKRVVLETIVGLLPREKNAMSVSFFSLLLRAAIYLETTVACRMDLEKRMGAQLGQAVIDDLLIPSFSFAGDTLFDVSAVHRIMNHFVDHAAERKRSGHVNNIGDDEGSDTERVAKLMESYLAEIASDRNLNIARFIGLAELVPEQSKATEDGMYRAIDIYLKAHPGLSDMERKKVCSLMDCQKLSREACAHAAQNDRLPVQTVVQVLYHEQQRLRDVMDGGGLVGAAGAESPGLVSRAKLFSEEFQQPVVPDELSMLRRENEDLKMELVKMKMRVKELERLSLGPGSPSIPAGTTTCASPAPNNSKPPLPRKSFINIMSKRLGQLSGLVRSELLTPGNAKGRNKPSKNRRHSIS